ncbi:MAG: AMP-binding protein [Emcibacteraceae bacterium]
MPFCQCAEVPGRQKGDRITLYMPMVPEAVYAMLACARIGAIHSVVFGGFSPEALAGRLVDCDSHIVITADEGLRGNKVIPLKNNVDEALEHPGTIVSTVIVVRVTGGDVGFTEGRDVWYQDEAAKVDRIARPRR